MELATLVYAATESFPTTERFGLAQQMRRAAVSVPSNIAEGYGRRTAKQRYSFLENALGSLFELETQVELCQRLAFNHDDKLPDLIRNIGRGLTALMRYVEDEAKHEKKNRHT